jgi:glc operon protein GlcG
MSFINKPVISLDLARKISDAAEAKAKAEGWKMVIAIVDHSGQLVHFTRMDHSLLISVRLSQLKASTSADIPVSTRRFREIAYNNAIGLDMTPGTTGVAGGLPIVTAAGQHLGAIGVSGGSEDQDEVCAQAGLDAVKDLL